jgi:hypothetical protein
MAKVFLSHSSKNKDFVRKLDVDLQEAGHETWLDVTQIRVGECIVSKINDGLSAADYAAVVLSKDAVQSQWFEREWIAKYWREIEKNSVQVLPVLIEDCEIPELIRSKKYADFRTDYGYGLSQLLAALSFTSENNGTRAALSPSPSNLEIGNLLSKIHSKTAPLSQCISDALILSQRMQNLSLEEFCRQELIGWSETKVDWSSDKAPTYRLAEVFVSASKLNLSYIGWAGSSAVMLDHIREDKENFFPFKMFVAASVSELETKQDVDTSRNIYQSETTQKAVLTKTKYPNAPLFVYGSADRFQVVLEAIKKELTKRLLAILPKVEGGVK